MFWLEEKESRAPRTRARIFEEEKKHLDHYAYLAGGEYYEKLELPIFRRTQVAMQRAKMMATPDHPCVLLHMNANNEVFYCKVFEYQEEEKPKIKLETKKNRREVA